MSSHHDAPPICREVRRLRLDFAGVSQEEAARRLGISLKAYRAYETYREPRLPRLRQIEQAFGVTQGTLIAFVQGSAGGHTQGELRELRDDVARRHDQLLERLERLEEGMRELLVQLRDARTASLRS